MIPLFLQQPQLIVDQAHQNQTQMGVSDVQIKIDPIPEESSTDPPEQGEEVGGGHLYTIAE